MHLQWKLHVMSQAGSCPLVSPHPSHPLFFMILHTCFLISPQTWCFLHVTPHYFFQGLYSIWNYFIWLLIPCLPLLADQLHDGGIIVCFTKALAPVPTIGWLWDSDICGMHYDMVFKYLYKVTLLSVHSFLIFLTFQMEDSYCGHFASILYD